MDDPIRPDFGGATDRGRVRASNQDQFLIAELSKSLTVLETSLAIGDSTRLEGRRPGYLFLVADGLGGAPEGARASALAADQVLRSVLGTLPWPLRLGEHEEDVEDDLKELFRKCQRELQADARENPSREGMGTTLTIALVLWPRLSVVHVGDARCYLFRSGRLGQITEDHTVQVPVPPRGKARAGVRQVLWNVIGGSSDEVWPEAYQETLRAGDLLLLSTDGLTRELSDGRLAEILATARTAKEATAELLRAANEAGGRDNLTAVVARFGDPPPPEADPAAARAEAAVIPSVPVSSAQP